MIYALGAFYGFHLGHKQLLIRAKQRADFETTGWGVFTFDGHPQQLFNKEGFKLLFTPEERDILVKSLSIPEIEKIPFTHTFAEQTPDEFINLISARKKIHGLVVGENFLFGRGRSGNPEMLAAMCLNRNWSLDVVPSYKINGVTVSSTAIREAILRGRIDIASEMLGHPFIIQSKIVKGDSRGRTLGYPTANMYVKTGKVYPARGSYTSIVFLGGKWYPAALNIGYNPTFEGIRALRCEVHISEFSGDLYGQTLTLFIIKRNRDEIRFPDVLSLKNQLEKDIKHTNTSANTYIRENKQILSNFEQILL